MGGRPFLTPERLAAHLEASVGEGTHERAALMLLRRRCWPGDGERLDAEGLHRLKVGGPRLMSTRPHRCPVGRTCPRCN